jgi:P27 family predicted phage terminase small subunit
VPTLATLTRVPTPPRRLNAEARKIFKRLAKIQIAMRTLTEADLDSLTTLASAIAEYHRLDAHVVEHFEEMLTSPCYPVALAMRDRAAERSMKLAQKFGMTPVDRTRLRIETEPVSEDPMAAMLAHLN